MSNLLHVIRLDPKRLKKTAIPVILEFPVGEETAPYLVSSSAAVKWIDEPPIIKPRPMIKAAVRNIDPGTFFAEVVEAVLTMGQDAEWGNVHPLNRDGLRAAVDHVESYGLKDLELLVPSTLAKDKLKEVVDDLTLPVRPSSWMPNDCIVVVPKDREYVGVVAKVTPKAMAGVAHNAARSIGIATGRGL